MRIISPLGGGSVRFDIVRLVVLYEVVRYLSWSVLHEGQKHGYLLLFGTSRQLGSKLEGRQPAGEVLIRSTELLGNDVIDSYSSHGDVVRQIGVVESVKVE